MRQALAIVALVASCFALPAAAETRGLAGAERAVIVAGTSAARAGAAYGPFRVLDSDRAALVDATDGASVGAFQAMLRDYPSIAVIEMVECPGTDDDSANLRLGRLIRAKGIATHVPNGGSVRSGAVELFLAGSRRLIDEGAEFAVHSWRDSDGREPDDYAADSPYNRAYLEYYREMGVTDPQAFYDMTNAVPNADARWLTAQDMRRWLGEAREGDIAVSAEGAGDGAAPTIAYLDLGAGFP